MQRLIGLFSLRRSAGAGLEAAAGSMTFMQSQQTEEAATAPDPIMTKHEFDNPSQPPRMSLATGIGKLCRILSESCAIHRWEIGAQALPGIATVLADPDGAGGGTEGKCLAVG